MELMNFTIHADIYHANSKDTNNIWYNSRIIAKNINKIFNIKYC